MSKIKITVTILITALLIILMHNISYADSYDYVAPDIVNKVKNNKDYSQEYSQAQLNQFIEYVKKFKADNLGTAAVGQHLLIGNTTLKGNTELYCMEHNQHLLQVYDYTVIKYMEIDGNQLSIPGTSTSRRNNTNIILAEILSRYENRYGEYAKYTKAQKALYMYLYTWLEWDPDQIKDADGKVINDGPQLSNRDYFGLQDIYSSDSFAENGINWDQTTKDGWDYVLPIISEVGEADKAGTLDQYKTKVKIYILEHKGEKRCQYLMIAIPEKPGETELVIDKRDSETDKGLKGAEFIIKNKDTGEYISTTTIEGYIQDNTYRVTGYSANSSMAYKFTTGLSSYKDITVIGLKPGKYEIEEITVPAGYTNDGEMISNIIVKEKIVNKIKLYNTKTPPPEDNADSGNGNVTISGTVWEDAFTGKSNKGNGQKDGSEKGVSGVIVYWREKSGKLIAKTKTNSNGYYSMKTTIDVTINCSAGCNCGDVKYHVDENDKARVNNSYIEFEYNGLKYTTVASSTKGANTSKAKEITSTRKRLDNSFGEVTASVVKTGGYSLNYDNHVGGDYISKLQQSNTDFPVKATTQNYLSKLFDNYKEVKGKGVYHTACSATYVCGKWTCWWECECTTKSKEDKWEIPNINLGLVNREQPDIALTSDIEQVRVIMKNQEYIYKYGNSRIQNIPEGTDIDAETDEDEKGNLLFSYNKFKVKFSQKYNRIYTRPVNPSDIAYVVANGTDDLQVYVKYKIILRNQSKTLPVMVKEIVNYYDANYTINNSATPGWEVPSKYGVSYSKNGYKSAYTQELDGTIIQPGKNSPTIEIEFRVNDDTVKRLINEEDILLYNVSEIHTYSSFYGSDTICSEYETASAKGWTDNQYAGIDKDSAPGNAVPGELNTYEDDTDQAPVFVLHRDEKYKIISGTVFEDTSVKTDGQRIGNGTLDSGENKVKNVKVELLRVLDNGKTELAKRYLIERGVPKAEDAVTYTIDDGSYNFTGVVVDNYIIRYTYGDRTITSTDIDASDSVDQSILNSPSTINGEKINARNYKSTIITAEPIKSIMKNGTGDQWHLTIPDNKSIAVDYLSKRQAIESLQYSNFETPINMTAYTKPFRVQVEYTPEQINYVETDGITIEGSNRSFVHNWPRFDFGIIERPREDIVIDKTIDNIKITLSNGQVLTEGSPYTEKLNYVKALGSKDIQTREQATKSNAKFLYIEMDSELIQGARLDIIYKITLTNNSEIDYEYDYDDYSYKYYYNDSVLDQHITTNEKAYYYYYGEVKTPLIKPTIETVVDYVDSELTCTVAETLANKDNEISRDDVNKVNARTFEYQENKEASSVTKLNWEQVKPGTNPDGTVKSPADKLYEQGLISQETQKVVNEQNYLVFTTNFFYDVVRGTSKDLYLFASKLLANQAEDYTYENHVEILKINGRIARNIDSTESTGKQVTKTYKPGTYMPDLKRVNATYSKAIDVKNKTMMLPNGTTIDRWLTDGRIESAGLHTQDDDMITIRITPPTGLENNAIIYIAVGAVALIVLAGGIYLIKKKVIG